MSSFVLLVQRPPRDLNIMDQIHSSVIWELNHQMEPEHDCCSLLPQTVGQMQKTKFLPPLCVTASVTLMMHICFDLCTGVVGCYITMRWMWLYFNKTYGFFTFMRVSWLTNKTKKKKLLNLKSSYQHLLFTLALGAWIYIQIWLRHATQCFDNEHHLHHTDSCCSGIALRPHC